MDRLPTERLVLRPFEDDDRDAFAAMNADPEVMRHFPSVLDRAASDAQADLVRAHAAAHGFAPYAVEVRGGPRFVGLVGALHVGFEAPFTPAVELLWRLRRDAWGHGYAVEAARAVLLDLARRTDVREVVAYTVPDNVRSRAVMERLRMAHDPADDFDHPRLPPAHPLRRHVVYRRAVGRG